MAYTLNALVTIKQYNNETIDGTSSRILWANEAAILYCDGSNWTKVGGKTLPMVGSAQRANSNYNIANAQTWYFVPMDTFSFGSVPNFYDTTNGRFTIQRPGVYNISMFAYAFSVKLGYFGVGIGTNTAPNGYASSGFDPGSGVYNAQAASFASNYNLVVGNTASLTFYAQYLSSYSNTPAIYGAAAPATLNITEMPGW